jgi:hypothetical protein
MPNDGRTLRREWLKSITAIVAGLPAAWRAAAAPAVKRAFEVETIGRRYGAGTASVDTAHYLVHATVSLASLPILSKSNVGGAVLQIEQYSAGRATTVAMQFYAGSWPARLKGFNRFGMTQEAVHQDAGNIVESAYLSFMTSSPEKDMNQARQSFTGAPRPLSFSVSHGRSTREEYSAVVDRLSMPGSHTWFDCGQIAESLRGAVSQAAASKQNEGALPTFLVAVRSAALNKAPYQTEFLQAGKIHRLKTSWDGKTANHQVLNGHIHDLDGRPASGFKVVFDGGDSSGMPLSIEFKPKSFLTLRFERTTPQHGPVVRPLLREESA